MPLSIDETENGYQCRPSSGGLVSAVTAYLSHADDGTFTENIWVGVPDCTEKVWKNAVGNLPQQDYGYLPVFVPKRTYELYYNGFSNSLIWPLFHYFPSFVEYNKSYFEAYTRVNELFAETLKDRVGKDDVVWIHDYHLMPLANLLRKKFPELTIGFFLHIPFPAYEIFRLIPKKWQREILTGMLGADLIGFHTIDYTTHFINCITRILRVENNEKYIQWDNRKIKAHALPISIDFDTFNSAFDNAEVVKKRKQYELVKNDKRLIFSVDRLDYTKGVNNRLKAYKLFLQQNPEYVGKVMFVLNIVPSRDSISKYAERKGMIDQYIGNLNASLGNIAWQPVTYQYGHLQFDELLALYTACDIALITPVRDGMNLVAKEFVASRKDKKGVLVLSEMAGASKELTEALMINPNDIYEIADVIKKSLEMDEEEQTLRMEAMQKQLAAYQVNDWAIQFFKELDGIKEFQRQSAIKPFDEKAKAHMLSAYAKFHKRLLLLDYDGTLVGFTEKPELAKPDAELLKQLKTISGKAGNDVYIISGRDSQSLEGWLGHLPVGLITEHGAKTRHVNGDWETENTSVMIDWKPLAKKTMNMFVTRCNGAFMEEKEYAVAWHYRNCKAAEGDALANELYEELSNYSIHLPLQVLKGNKVIEIRHEYINKGTAVQKLMQRKHYDFVFAIGDDRTDEDMFKELAETENAFTVKVGTAPSEAMYKLTDAGEVRPLLNAIAATKYKSKK